MAQAITEVFMTHGALVTVLSPLILSAAAELQEHMDSDNSGISSLPVWTQIQGDDRRIQGHPLFPATLHYESDSRSPSPQAGPSKTPALPAKERGRGTHHPAISKKQRGKSRAIITTDDELDEDSDEVAPPPTKPKVADPPSRKTDQYVEVTTKDKMDADEERVITVVLKMGAKKITNFSGAILTEDEFTDTSAPTWAPRCGQCVARDLICCQGFNKNNSWTLKVCALCSRLKICCGGKGSNPPSAKGKSSAARRAHSQSRCRPSPIQEDPAPDASPLVEEEPAPPATPVAANPESSQMQDDPEAASPSPILLPSCVAHEQEMEALKLEVARLRSTVKVLVAQVVAGDQLLQAAYTRLDVQDNRTDLLAGRIADIYRLVDPPSSAPPTDIAADECHDLAAGPANDMEDSACLPIVIKTPEAEDSNVSGEPAM
ncbi:uncharacterized protein F5147DRAFT_653153 [Suillus discolor]|uniref:Uncharacterized protein n=1 Tax=Suillus discolor TaxID=1912936 RepID=A0A9P7F5R9_9AGAM|nr:uncharacterized protein F5147DRAFT_653153 [Suillus discolor]KAG2108073.1 hypothetical protein F5147DRAFT_653153 [Suillus discolor]